MSKNSTLKILGSYAWEKKSELYFPDIEGFGVIRISPEYAPFNLVLYCANDIARALGYEEPAKAVTNICRKSLKRVICTKYGMQEMKFIVVDEVEKLIRHSKLAQIQKDELVKKIDGMEKTIMFGFSMRRFNE